MDFVLGQFIITRVIQKVLPVLSTETLLHILLSTEYYGFRPSSTAVDTLIASRISAMLFVFGYDEERL